MNILQICSTRKEELTEAGELRGFAAFSGRIRVMQRPRSTRTRSSVAAAAAAELEQQRSRERKKTTEKGRMKKDLKSCPFIRRRLTE